MGAKTGKFALPKMKGAAKDEVQDPNPAEENVEKAEGQEQEAGVNGAEDTTKPDGEAASKEGDVTTETAPASNGHGSTEKEDGIQELPEQKPETDAPAPEKSKKKKNPISWLKKSFRREKKPKAVAVKQTNREAEQNGDEKAVNGEEKPAENGEQMNGDATEEPAKDAPEESPSHEEQKTEAVNGDSSKPENGQED